MDKKIICYNIILMTIFSFLLFSPHIANATYRYNNIHNRLPTPRNDLTAGSALHSNSLGSPHSNHNGQRLRCHDCAKKGCEQFITRYPQRSGKCETKKGEGKCFIRRDPNLKLYWGCIDDYFWPEVPWRGMNGCTEDWQNSWKHKGVRRPLVWCFCDTDDCNVSIEQLNNTSSGGDNGGTTTTILPTRPTTKPERCYTSNNQAVAGQTTCEQVCDIINGKAVCSCWNGFMLQSDGRSCMDIDECSRSNRCAHSCVNTYGSFYCTCDWGYTLAPDTATCNDVNECQMNNGGCSDGCENLLGSFLCTCPKGYFLSADERLCQDVNECTLNNGGCEQMCLNFPGGYQCQCMEGYVIMPNNFTCGDINECQMNNGGCSDGCQNLLGSFLCTCPNGYILSPNGRMCQDMNECLVNNGGCSQVCVNEPGTFSCQCFDNSLYTVATDGVSCQATCPDSFITGYDMNTCYKIFSPTLWDKSAAKDYFEAGRECQNLHPLARLISIDNVLEKEFIAGQLRILQRGMLDSWQGWWTSAKYNDIAGEFIWAATNILIDSNNPLWTFKKDPPQDTCLWIMQVASYDYTWGNFECETKSGYICEINIPTMLN